MPDGMQLFDPTDEVRARLRAIADDIMQGDPQPYDKAADRLIAVVRAGPTAADTLDVLARDGALALIHAVAHDRREGARRAALSRTTPTVRERPVDRGAMVAASQAAMGSLLDTWLVGGRRLGDCTGAQVRAAAATAAAQARGHARNARFYAALSRRVPIDGAVRDHVDDAAAADLLRAAEATD
jgi:hypothetical protein